MDFDAGVIVGLVSLAAFFGFIVWAEVYSRRRRRQPPGDEKLPAPRTKPTRRTTRED